jgi:hypothetical protein
MPEPAEADARRLLELRAQARLEVLRRTQEQRWKSDPWAWLS